MKLSNEFKQRYNEILKSVIEKKRDSDIWGIIENAESRIDQLEFQNQLQESEEDEDLAYEQSDELEVEIDLERMNAQDKIANCILNYDWLFVQYKFDIIPE